MKHKDPTKLYTCYTCLRFDDLSDKLARGENPPKECKRCAWHSQGDELPLSKRPNYLEYTI